MRETPLILIVDDQPDNRQILEARLSSRGYNTATACDGEDAIRQVRDLAPDLVLLDVMMPKLDGFEVCRRLRADPNLPFIPIVLVTARSDVKDLVVGLEAGANDYLTKPVQQTALVARVRSMLRIKSLHDEVEEQRQELAGWNAALKEKVAAQVEVIERTNRLRRFLPSQVAEAIVTADDEASLLSSHRGEVTVLFADLRGFTAFAEQSEPETVIAALHAFHRFAVPLVNDYEGTLERFLGDGIVVIFNDPLPCPDHTERAVNLAGDLQSGFHAALARYQSKDCSLGLGIGVARGIATLGQIGFEGRLDYAAIGSVSNLAARLCDQAVSAQTLVSAEVVDAIPRSRKPNNLGQFSIKGFADPVTVHDLPKSEPATSPKK